MNAVTPTVKLHNYIIKNYSTDTILWFYSKIRDFTWTNTVNIYSEDGV